MARVLIAGCGYVGAATAELFQAAGWEVEGWTHSAESAARLGEKLYVVRPVDISERAAVDAAARKFDAVIHCASSGGGGAADYRRVYLAGARNLMQALRPARFIFTSSTSVYAQTNGEWVDEESAAEPQHETGRILRETEEFVRENGGTVARLAGIYGPGRSVLLRRFLSGEARLEGDGGRFLNQVHRDDIAAAFVYLTSLPNDGIFNVSDDEPITQRAAYAWMAQTLERPLPRTAEEVAVRKRGASNKRVSNRKLRGLGWKLLHPDFRSGIAASVIPSEVERSGTKSRDPAG
ncbi:MAG: NAD-dependent epimerase/dehydratase family protein [Chthoniobacterales bacterium]|nr:NAD-dependent epimerase/dehydratase family protein [Chthoniobacterales bacterium]